MLWAGEGKVKIVSNQVIIQPDGKFAIWSTISGEFVIMNATERELTKHWVEEGIKDTLNYIIGEIERKKQNKVTHLEMNWEKCLNNTKQNHGDSEFDRIMSIYQESNESDT